MATERLRKAALQEKADLEEGYDDAVREKTKPTKTLDVLGREFTIPASPPAWVQLFVARYGRGDTMELPPEKYLDFIVKLLGDEIIDHIIEVGDNYFDADDLQKDVMGKIMDSWQGKKKK